MRETEDPAFRALTAARQIVLEANAITTAVDLYKQQNVVVLNSVTMKQFAEELIKKVESSVAHIKCDADEIVFAATPPARAEEGGIPTQEPTAAAAPAADLSTSSAATAPTS